MDGPRGRGRREVLSFWIPGQGWEQDGFPTGDYAAESLRSMMVQWLQQMEGWPRGWLVSDFDHDLCLAPCGSGARGETFSVACTVEDVGSDEQRRARYGDVSVAAENAWQLCQWVLVHYALVLRRRSNRYPAGGLVLDPAHLFGLWERLLVGGDDPGVLYRSLCEEIRAWPAAPLVTGAWYRDEMVQDAVSEWEMSRDSSRRDYLLVTRHGLATLDVGRRREVDSCFVSQCLIRKTGCRCLFGGRISCICFHIPME